MNDGERANKAPLHGIPCGHDVCDVHPGKALEPNARTVYAGAFPLGKNTLGDCHPEGRCSQTQTVGWLRISKNLYSHRDTKDDEGEFKENTYVVVWYSARHLYRECKPFSRASIWLYGDEICTRAVTGIE